MIRFVRSLAILHAIALFSPSVEAATARRLIRQLAGRKAEKAASQLADLGKEALEPLLKALQHRSWKIRYWAAYALAYNKEARDGGAIEALKALFSDRKLRVRLRAAMALAKLGDKSGLDLAREHLKSPRGYLRAEAVAALAASADAAVVPALKESLKDTEPRVRYWALIGLRDLAGAEALPLGLQYLNDPSEEVKMAAMEVLGSAGKDSAEAEAALLKLLDARRASVRQYAVSVLARIAGKNALGPLRKVRDSDRNPDVRATADAAVVEVSRRLKSRP
jgi:HEAT repeat protein